MYPVLVAGEPLVHVPLKYTNKLEWLYTMKASELLLNNIIIMTNWASIEIC